MKKVIIILLSLMVIGAWVIYKKTIHHHEISSQITPVHQEEKPVVNTVVKQQQVATTTKPALSAPASYHPVKGVLQQTIYVGTAEHPTINGGIINAPGLAVNRDLPEASPQEKKLIDNKVNQSRPLLASNKVEKTDIDYAEPFQDNWATSERVRMLLSEATQEGKLNYVLQKTGEMGLPASLAVVPMVESNYKNNAISVKGAAGAWQLMPTTAKDYGLNKQDRFQFNIATNAALKLLNDLHQQFGNWQLAFAAYNAGSQRVKIALAKNPHAQTVDDLDLPLETKAYVKKIMNLNKTMISMEDSHV